MCYYISTVQIKAKQTICRRCCKALALWKERGFKMENIEVMASFDKKVKDYISLNEQLKEMKKEIETEKAQLEKLYRKPNDIEERLEGIETFMEKVTIRKEKTYDLKGLRVLLKALGINKDDVISRKWEFVVD